MSTLKVLSPYDEHLIKELPLNTPQEVERKLTNAYQVFSDRSQWLPTPKRIEILEKTYRIMQTRQHDLARAAAEEGGKPLMDSEVEAARAVQGVKVALETLSHMNGTEIPMNLTASSQNRLAVTSRQPVGVVLAISAFNHPLNLIVHQVIPAIAVGCPVIVKPASSTPLSCYNLVDILYEAGLPQEWCQIILCDNQTAEKVVADPRISFFTFIGSGKVGWYLRSKLPPGATCTLEHGGAAPVIIEPDADIEAALPLLTKGGFYHAGQVCVSVQRVFAHADIANKVANGIADLAKKLVVGDPVDPNTEVGPLIARKEVDRVTKWVDEAVAKGATVLCGGKKMNDTCYEPTVLLNPSMDVTLSQKEIFGPVVCIYTYNDRSEAIQRANSLPFSFQASVFTQNIDTALDTVQHLEAMAVMVNDHTAFRVDWMPFGGRKQSGLGVGGINYTMHEMTYEKMMVIKSGAL